MGTSRFDLQAFNEGEYWKAVDDKVRSENISKVLYPAMTRWPARRCACSSSTSSCACALQDMHPPAACSVTDRRRWSAPTSSRCSSTTRTRLHRRGGADAPVRRRARALVGAQLGDDAARVRLHQQRVNGALSAVSRGARASPRRSVRTGRGCPAAPELASGWCWTVKTGRSFRSDAAVRYRRRATYMGFHDTASGSVCR